MKEMLEIRTLRRVSTSSPQASSGGKEKSFEQKIAKTAKDKPIWVGRLQAIAPALEDEDYRISNPSRTFPNKFQKSR